MSKWEKPDCNICNTKKYLRILWRGVTTWEHPGKFNFVRCTNCGLVFQSPRAPFKEAVQYYPSQAYWGRDVTKFENTKKLKEERERAYSFLYKGIFKRKKTGSVLDIGSGLGLFLSKFKEKKWSVIGTDISSDVAKYSQKLFGVKVVIGDVIKMKFENKSFDLITLNGVFEHIYDPASTLKKCRQILKENGLLVMAIPNIESLGYKIHQKNWYHLQPGRHIYHFSPKTIVMLLKKEGFRVLQISHAYKVHNYYSLYENIRFRFSPKFVKKNSGGLKMGTAIDTLKPRSYSLINEAGKYATHLFAEILCFIEPIVKRSEVITVYAEKK